MKGMAKRTPEAFKKKWAMATRLPFVLLVQETTIALKQVPTLAPNTMGMATGSVNNPEKPKAIAIPIVAAEVRTKIVKKIDEIKIRTGWDAKIPKRVCAWGLA